MKWKICENSHVSIRLILGFVDPTFYLGDAQTLKFFQSCSSCIYLVSFRCPMIQSIVPGTAVLGRFTLYVMYTNRQYHCIESVQLNETCYVHYRALFALNQLQYSGSLKCPVTPETLPGTLVLGVFYPHLVCAALIQLTYWWSFNCPMTHATIPGALVLGVFFVVWYVLPWASWSTQGQLIYFNVVKQTKATWDLSSTLLRGWPMTRCWCWVCIWPDCLNNLYAVEVFRVIQLSNDTCNSPQSSCTRGVFLIWYVLPWSSWSTRGHSIVQWHLRQSLELLSWGYFSLFGTCCLEPVEVLSVI